LERARARISRKEKGVHGVRKSRFSVEQIVFVLKQAETGPGDGAFGGNDYGSGTFGAL
jgi:hypothetical protein